MKTKTKTKSAATPVLIRLEEAAAILETDPQNVRNWVKAGVIEPAIRGGKGRGLSTQFTVGQVVGLIVAGGYRRSPRGALLPYLRERIEEYANWPWSALEGLLGLRTDDWTEEALAKVLGPVRSDIETAEPSQRSDLKYLQYMCGSILRLRDIVLVHPVYTSGRSHGTPSK